MTELKDGFDGIAAALKAGVEIKDRKYRLTLYKECFVGSEAVDFMVSQGVARSRSDAVKLGNALIADFHIIEHVTRDHEFKDDYLFYRFIGQNERGSFAVNEDTGKNIVWSDFLAPSSRGGDHRSLLPKLPQADLEAISPKDAHVASHVWPLDEYNQTLLNHVHPPSWKDPDANQGKDISNYDLVVIGAGTGGLVSAAGSAGVGAKVALIEENLMGGDW